MPESCRDRPTSAWEHIWLLAKSERYYYDADAVREEHQPESLERYKHGFNREKVSGDGLVMADAYSKVYGNPAGRNQRNWWLLGPEPYPDAHFATFPTEIPRRAILAGCPLHGLVLDPFLGSGTVGQVAESLGRRWVGLELSAEYGSGLAKVRTAQLGLFT
jgi:DNA modification methylase